MLHLFVMNLKGSHPSTRNELVRGAVRENIDYIDTHRRKHTSHCVKKYGKNKRNKYQT